MGLYIIEEITVQYIGMVVSTNCEVYTNKTVFKKALRGAIKKRDNDGYDGEITSDWRFFIVPKTPTSQSGWIKLFTDLRDDGSYCRYRLSWKEAERFK